MSPLPGGTITWDWLTQANEIELYRNPDSGHVWSLRNPGCWLLSERPSPTAPEFRPLRAQAWVARGVSQSPAVIYPVRHGLLLHPLHSEEQAKGTVTLAIPPPELNTDLSGIKLVLDEACRDWVQACASYS